LHFRLYLGALIGIFWNQSKVKEELNQSPWTYRWGPCPASKYGIVRLRQSKFFKDRISRILFAINLW